MNAATKQAEKPAPESKGEVAVLQKARLPYDPAMEKQFGIERAGWSALIDAVFPAAKSVEAVVLALSYCKARNLDPFKKMVHIVPVWSTQAGRMVEGVWPGIGEHRATATRTGQYAGCDETVFGENATEKFTGKVKRGDGWETITVEVTFPTWARITVYKIIHGARVPFVGPRVYWKSAYGRQGKADVPNDMWQRRASEQLEKCAEAAALRKAFPEELGDIATAEEMEGRIVDITPGAPVPEPAPPPPKPERADFEKKTEDKKDPPPEPTNTPPATETKAPEKPMNAAQKKMYDGLMAELDQMTNPNTIWDWEIGNQEKLDRLKASFPEARAKISAIINEKTKEPGSEG